MKISWGKTTAVWWSTAWRGTIYGMLGGFVLGFLGGVVAAAMHRPDQVALYGAIGGYIAAIPASMLAMKQALGKHLLSLVALAQPDAQQGAAADAAKPRG